VVTGVLLIILLTNQMAAYSRVRLKISIRSRSCSSSSGLGALQDVSILMPIRAAPGRGARIWQALPRQRDDRGIGLRSRHGAPVLAGDRCSRCSSRVLAWLTLDLGTGGRALLVACAAQPLRAGQFAPSHRNFRTLAQRRGCRLRPRGRTPTARYRTCSSSAKPRVGYRWRWQPCPACARGGWLDPHADTL